MNKTLRTIAAAAIAFILLELVTIIVGLATSLTYTESFRIIFGSLYVLFLPGFVWTFVFFPKKRHEKSIDLIERIALSFALSIAIVPLAIFYLNLAGLPITTLSSFTVILILIVIGFGVIRFKQRRSSKEAFLPAYQHRNYYSHSPHHHSY